MIAVVSVATAVRSRGSDGSAELAEHRPADLEELVAVAIEHVQRHRVSGLVVLPTRAEIMRPGGAWDIAVRLGAGVAVPRPAIPELRFSPTSWLGVVKAGRSGSRSWSRRPMPPTTRRPGLPGRLVFTHAANFDRFRGSELGYLGLVRVPLEAGLWLRSRVRTRTVGQQLIAVLDD